MNSTFTLSKEEKLPSDEDVEVKAEGDIANETATIADNVEEVNPELTNVVETSLPSSSSEINADLEQAEEPRGANLNGTMTIETRALNESYTVEPTVPDPDHKGANNQRHHVRRNTITLEAGGLNKEISDLIKEIVESNPPDLKEALKEKLTDFTLRKEEEWRENFEKSVARTSAQLEMKLSATVIETERENPKDATFLLPVNPHINHQMEQAMRERDQFKDQIYTTMRTVNEQAKQHDFFMEKSQKYEKELKQLRKEQQMLEDSIVETHNRYNALLREAEQHAIEIDENVALINKQHDETTIALRYKVRQQELKIKSMSGMVESLTNEKNELIEMCDGLVAEVDKKVTANLNEVEAPEHHIEDHLEVSHLEDNQLDSIMDPSFTEADGAEDEAFVDAESELTPESTKHDSSQNDDLGGF
ncbi:hypothetical protein FO519_007487 [Halicephalobus sp. NKZ332]|nr:hypothetical protein FO519_007487 [Halicephalobus sp. NKZ332]